MSNWIPRNIMPPIQDAIRATDKSAWVFHITGEAGTGKTVSLRQVGQELGSHDGVSPSFPWSGILDLYHSSVNSNSGLEARLMKALERTDEFEVYHREREVFAARRKAGILAQELEEERSRLASIFAQCVNRVTAHHRVVIALDTTERIRYGIDEVQTLCQLQDEATTVRSWLLDQVGRWKNCVVLLAGRPDATLTEALEKQLTNKPGIHFETIKLSGFDKTETLAYFAKMEGQIPALADLGDAERRRLFQVTEGRPIRIEWALEVMRYSLGWDGLWQRIQQIQQLPVEEAKRSIDRALVDRLMNDPLSPFGNPLRYLSVARKGLSDQIMASLAPGKNEDACQKELDAVADLGFVKKRPEDGRLFLHDEMFELCDAHLVAGDVPEWSKRLVSWYDTRIKLLENEEDEAISPEKRRIIREQLRDAQVDSLVYRLRADPREGYQWYTKRAEYAIRAAEVGFDMRLRNEILAFLHSDSPVDRRALPWGSKLRKEIACDAAAHWVKRYMIRGKNTEAVEIAQKVLQDPHLLGPAGDPAFRWGRADLAVYHAQALIYVNRAAEAIRILKSALADLEGDRNPETLAQEDRHSFDGWRRNLILGRAHNNLGYAYWMVTRQYGLALEEFRRAQVYFRAADLREEIANTADNMGRVYAALFRRSHAEALVEDGLQLREKLGLDYRVALSQISRAIVHLAFWEPHRAHEVARQALSTCEGLETPRGVGLACLVTGSALRQLGALWSTRTYGYDQCQKWLTEARQHLERAVDIFKNKVTEPVRLIDAYNELGCTYREWIALEQRFNPYSALPATLVGDAVQHLLESRRLAEHYESPVQYVDACEDLAQIYFVRGDYAAARLWLDRAEERIPVVYKIAAGQELQSIPTEECVEEFWQMMGKIELLRGHLVYDREAEQSQGKVARPFLEEAMRHYAFAAAYFERHSGQTVRLETTRKQVYNRVRRCRIEDLRYIQDEFLRSLGEIYKLDPSALGGFFEETLGLALQLSG